MSNFRIIISPAKKMIEDFDIYEPRRVINFPEKTMQILTELKAMDRPSLEKLWKASSRIVDLNVDRIRNLDLTLGLVTPAIVAYEGIQYKHLGGNSLSERELEYLDEHLRILSGFYGILKPLDGVKSYRLEMEAKISINSTSNLYEFWGDSIANFIRDEIKGKGFIINLASKEYSKVLEPYLNENLKMVDVIFGQFNKGKIIEKGTLCKMARGDMVRYLASKEIYDLDILKEFNIGGYKYNESYSEDDKLVFIKED